MIQVRRLNPLGIEAFEKYLDSLTSETPQAAPLQSLTAPESSESLGVTIKVEQRSFATRYELGGYLYSVIDGSGLQGVDADRGLWAWLALFYFESMCTADRWGRRKPGKRARWIPETHDFQRYYRHLLAGPYRIYRAYSSQPDLAMSLLCGHPDRPGDLVEQLVSRQELVTNPAVVGLATKMYYDQEVGELKRGGGGKGPGSPRRLAAVLRHFDVTYDLYSLGVEELSCLLPREFDRFPREFDVAPESR